MNKADLQNIWESIFDAKVLIEDELAMEQAGQGRHKKGVMKTKLRRAESCLSIVQEEIEK